VLRRGIRPVTRERAAWADRVPALAVAAAVDRMLAPEVVEAAEVMLAVEAVVEAGPAVAAVINKVHEWRWPRVNKLMLALLAVAGLAVVIEGRQTAPVRYLESEPYDVSQDDELYAWSCKRAAYDAAASYDAATTLPKGSAVTAGWYFDVLLGCWAWLPSSSYFSPFGWGFYSPVTVRHATVVQCSVSCGGHWHKGDRHWVGVGTMRPVAINPKHPPAHCRFGDAVQ
jgi:hypothetical protein